MEREREIEKKLKIKMKLLDSSAATDISYMMPCIRFICASVSQAEKKLKLKVRHLSNITQ